MVSIADTSSDESSRVFDQGIKIKTGLNDFSFHFESATYQSHITPSATFRTVVLFAIRFPSLPLASSIVGNCCFMGRAVSCASFITAPLIPNLFKTSAASRPCKRPRFAGSHHARYGTQMWSRYDGVTHAQSNTGCRENLY